MRPFASAPLVQAANAQSAPTSLVSGVINLSTREGLMPNSDSMAPDYFQSLLGEADVSWEKQANLTTMKEAFTHVARRKDDLKQSVQQLHERVDTLETTRDFVNFDFDHMAREIPRLRTRNATLEGRVAVLETDNQELKRLCARLETDNQDQKKTNAHLEGEIKALQKAVNELLTKKP